MMCINIYYRNRMQERRIELLLYRLRTLHTAYTVPPPAITQTVYAHQFSVTMPTVLELVGVGRLPNKLSTSKFVKLGRRWLIET
jgi:hypothetical protein